MKTEYMLTPRWRWDYRISFILYTFVGLYPLYGLISGLDVWPTLATPLTLTQRICLVPILLVGCIYNGALSFHRDFFERFVLLPNGIQYQAFGYTVYADWSDLKRIGNSRIIVNKIEGVFIDYSAQNAKIWFPGQISRKEIFIPLSMFAKNWRDSELGQQIKQHAPQLFSSVES